jgi:crossover junction endodeoxyribonuclease RusA
VKSVSFFVVGLPKPAGSKRGFSIRRGGVFTGRVAITDACAKSREWKSIVADIAAEYIQAQPFAGALRVHFAFYIPRPKGHYGTGKNLLTVKASAPDHHIVKPDVLKLARAVEDALTGIAWRDDAQIVSELIEKCYCAGKPGVQITVEEL